jgi:glycosyltransferase involved in cell wall biosynthesis
MKICLDIRSPGTTGILSYSNGLIKSLFKLRPDAEFTIITDGKHNSWHNAKVREIIVPTQNPISWVIWSNTVLARILEKEKIDVYHSFKHVTLFRSHAKKILTLHGGPALYQCPDLYKWNERAYWKSAFALALKTYDCIITDAEAEITFFANKLSLPKDKFRFAHLAADECFRIIQDNEKLQRITNKFKLPANFILFVGQIHPRKNLEAVIKAYHRARNDLPAAYKLVIVGQGKPPYSTRINQLIRELNISEDVIFLGHISTDDLIYIYNLASLFLLPSYYENFGIIFLEAMACGVPVITSDITDINEVVGDAALRVNPTSIAEIAEGILSVLRSVQLQDTMIQAGFERSKLFSWDRCARETVSIYEALTNSEEVIVVPTWT